MTDLDDDLRAVHKYFDKKKNVIGELKKKEKD